METTTEVTTPSPATLTSEEAQNLFDYAIMQISDGRSDDEIADMMASRGISTNEARKTVPMLRRQFAQAKLEHANKETRNGALWCLGGIAISVLTYSMASGGGSYLLCWGPVIFGGIQFVKGLNLASTARQELEAAGGHTIDAEAKEVKYME